MGSIEFGRTAIIKGPVADIGPAITVGGSVPILEQARSVASAAWERTKPAEAVTPADPHPAQLFFENNVRLLSIITGFSPRPQLNAADAVLEAESILSQARTMPEVLPPQVAVAPNPVVKQAETVSEKVGLDFQTSGIVFSQNEQKARPQEVVEEKKLMNEANEADETGVLEQEQIEQLWLRNVEDWQVSQQRRNEIKKAIGKTRIEVVRSGIRKILGWMVAKFLPGQHEGNTSQIVRKKGLDGSLVDTAQAIKNDPREFESEQEAKEGLLPYVALFKPAKKALRGEPLPKQHVVRVLKFVKHIFAYEIFVQRIIKKRVQVSGQEGITREETETKVESSLEDYPQLAAVLNPVSIDRFK